MKVINILDLSYIRCQCDFRDDYIFVRQQRISAREQRRLWLFFG